MPVTVVLEGGLVNTVLDNETCEEAKEYDVVDLDLWESGECPFCHTDGCKVMGAELDERRPGTVYYGGVMTCTECGCDEDTAVSDWLKAGRKNPDTTAA